MTKLTFDAWKRLVDQQIEQLVGLSCDDLPDYDYYGEWECGSQPRAVARRVVVECANY